MVGNILALVFALVYGTSNYWMYKNWIYPMLIRTYYRDPVNDREDTKKDIRHLVSMTIGLLILVCWWIGYLSTFLLVAKTGGTEDFSVTCFSVSGFIFVLSMLATGWPKPIGRFILRKE